jgi:hypothetical protein
MSPVAGVAAAGDDWTATRSSAYPAIQDVMQSENITTRRVILEPPYSVLTEPGSALADA